MDDIKELVSVMSTKPYEHQINSLLKANLVRAFANFSEQGTGKTWSTIAEMFALNQLGEIDRVLVLAPKGVDSNWFRKELPAHAPDHASFHWHAALWRPQKTKAKIKELTDLFEYERFKILCMNWEAIRSERGWRCAEMFVTGGPAMIVADESHRIKTPTAATTKAALRLARQCGYRRALTGTPSTGSPFDFWSQMMFLSPAILDGISYRAFCARHAAMMDDADHVYAAIKRQIRAKLKRSNPDKPEAWVDKVTEQRAPQMVRKGFDGSPLYKNLLELKETVSHYSFRVTKEECLDLPDKIYTQTFFELTPQQTKIYNELKHRLRLMFDDETVLPMIKLTAMQKMSQVCSGYFITPDDGVQRIAGDNPKLLVLKERLEDLCGKSVIIWGLLRQELKDIAKVCKELGIKAVEYHGGVGDAAKDAAINEFQDGTAQVFIGQQQSGGVGLTLTAAEHVFYYSNSFNLEHRLQSEDRAHRIGQHVHVVYHDFIAEGTIEEQVVAALQRKDNIVRTLVGDVEASKLFLS